MRSYADKRRALRAAMTGSEMVLAPGCSDPVSAKLVERMGLRAIHASGSVFHRTSGYADAGILTMDEMLGRIHALTDAVDIPVIADGDTGFGNVVNVVRTIKEYERAGAAAIHIEDLETPKRPVGQGVAGGVISRKEMVNKIKAAVDARTDQDFIIIARSDVQGDDREAIDRLAECCEAGADAAFIGYGDAESMRALKKAVARPLVGVLPRDSTAIQYKEWGADVALLPGAMQIAALYAQKKMLEELKRSGTAAGYFAGLPGIEDVQQFYNRMGHAELEAIQKRFGGG